ncbi:HAD hydrolase family protein [Mycobacterium sp. SM1]|uniref:HAD hydrolase family protein n=1 Tax=Mycobacterium sp. SM1 TaxID=2816243 RepID=UPI001BCADD32|nr:HAD hydrolase family protein [Mycobacterium sp. SM1]MBS4730703.1 HAD hydrolase family protein [Mycobacterium sp. SM1]
MAFFQVVALDLDGTLTSRGKVCAKALDAIDQVRRNGVVVVLVTGRIARELEAAFPRIADRFDVLILENGAVAAIDGKARALSAPVDAALDDVLAARGVPYRRGTVLMAVDGDHAATVVGAIGELGLDCQVIRNRDALMVLPAGVTKGTGLGAVLAELNLSPHNAIAVGDAENDLSLFGMAEIGAAVADAVPSVREHADLILEGPDGLGVAGLLTGPYLSGARRYCPPRRWIRIGTFDDGTPARVPGSQARILVTGPAGAGKSYLVGLMAEKWILAGYCVLAVDPEGDHVELRELSQVQAVDARHYLPEPTELLDTMLRPNNSIVVDLSALDEPDKIDYLRRLRSIAEAHRQQHGFPHWVIYDEAHLLGTDQVARWTRRGGYVLCSFAPASLPARELDSTDVVLELTRDDLSGAGASQTKQWATLRFGSRPARRLTLADRRTTHVRHRHKYADISLPDERRFYFHPVDGQYVAPAATMHDFGTAIRHLDPQALRFHLERGDFSRWLESTIADKDFAAHVAAWEDELLAHQAAELERIRHRLAQAVEERYLDTPKHD